MAANGLSKMYHSLSFIVSFVVTTNAMSIIKHISVKLQYTSYDIVKAFNKVEEVVKEACAVRSDETMLHSWYAQAECLASKVDVVPQACDNVGHCST